MPVIRNAGFVQCRHIITWLKNKLYFASVRYVKSFAYLRRDAGFLAGSMYLYFSQISFFYNFALFSYVSNNNVLLGGIHPSTHYMKTALLVKKKAERHCGGT